MAIHAGYQWNETGVTNSDAINTPAFSRNIKEVSVSHIGIGEMQYLSVNSKTYLKKQQYLYSILAIVCLPMIYYQLRH